MTEAEARALLRNPHAPCIPQVGLFGSTRDWIAAQPWHATGLGWMVEGNLDGLLFHVDVEPGAERPALYIASANRRTRAKLPGVWIERPMT